MAVEQKKLLVLDVNGLLVDTYFHKEKDRLPPQPPDATIGKFYVYKRPFCDEFVRFCLENFIVGIWSSARRHNVENLVDYIFQGAKQQLAFMWHQTDCTDTGLKHPENKDKPIFLKELSKLWESLKSSQLLEVRDFGPSNTLLVDDSPYKALRNPPYTAIFPRPYTAYDMEDASLSGALRNYLERICDAADVQTHVRQNPFGEPSITVGSLLWDYYNEGLKLEDHAQFASFTKRIKLSTGHIDEWSFGVSKKEDPELTEGSSSVQVRVDSATESEKAQVEQANNLGNNSVSTSSRSVFVETHIESNSEYCLLDHNPERKQESCIRETNMQVSESSKKDCEKNDERLTRQATRHDVPVKFLGLHDNQSFVSSHGNAEQERDRKHREGCWGIIQDPLQKLSWQGNENSFSKSTSILPGNHNGGESSDREFEICPKGPISLGRTIPNFTRGNGSSQRNFCGLDAYSERFAFGGKDLGYVHASSDAYNGRLSYGSDDSYYSASFSGIGNSDIEDKCYPGHSYGVLQNTHATERLISDTSHRIGHCDSKPGFSDRTFSPCHHSQSERSRQLNRAERSECFQGTGKYAYRASWNCRQSDAKGFVFDNRGKSISEHSTSSSSLSHRYLGESQHSRYMTGDEKQWVEALPGDMGNWRKGSDTGRVSSGSIPPRVQWRQPGHFPERVPFKIQQRHPYPDHVPERVPFENGSGRHHYKDYSSQHRTWKSFPGSSHYSHFGR